LLTPNFYVEIAAFYNNYNHLSSTEPGIPFTETSPQATYRVVPSVIGNGLRGLTSGFEIAPSWRPARWWRVAGSYSYLHINMEPAPGSRDTSSARSLAGSSPHHQLMVQSFLDLSPKIELTQTFRYVSDLPAQQVSGYSTMDARLAW